MRPERLSKFLTQSIKAKRRVLIKGKPGIGKSDIVAQAANEAQAELAFCFGLA